MATRPRFNFQWFIGAWSRFRDLPPMTSYLEDMQPDRRAGLAALALISSSREHWLALGVLASYADEERRSIPDLLAVNSPGGAFAYASARQMASWATTQSFSGELGDPGQLTAAIYTIGSSFRAEVVAMAVESGGQFDICEKACGPDEARILRCLVLGYCEEPAPGAAAHGR
jgi:hypothetical protein